MGLSVVASGGHTCELDNTVWETRVLLTLGMIAHDIFGSRLMVRFKNSNTKNKQYQKYGTKECCADDRAPVLRPEGLHRDRACAAGIVLRCLVNW